jgi:hypothetical protein
MRITLNSAFLVAGLAVANALGAQKTDDCKGTKAIICGGHAVCTTDTGSTCVTCPRK